MVSLFDRIKGAKASADSNYFTPGEYLVRIDRVLEKRNRKENDIFIVECTIAHVFTATGSVVVEPAPGEENLAPKKPGEQVGWVVNFSGKGADSAPGNVKAFILNVTDSEEAETNEDDLRKCYEQIVGPEQRLAGQFCRVSAVQRPSRVEPGKPQTFWTKVSWKSIVDADYVAKNTTQDEKNRLGIPS